MCQKCGCKCCCNNFSMILFIIFGLIGSFITNIFICNSFFNTIPYYDYFQDKWLNYTQGKDYYIFDYSEYYNLKEIYIEYGKLSDNKNLSSIDLSLHFIILPTFLLLSFIFSFSFVCCKIDYIIFIVFEIISLIIKGLCIFDSILFHLKRQKLLPVDVYIDYINGENQRNYILFKISKEYNDFIKKSTFSDIFLVFSLSFLALEILIFLIFIGLNCKDSINNKEDETNNKSNKITQKIRKTIIFYTIFGLLSMALYIFGNYIYFNCNLKYKNGYEENKIYNYKYEEYPILKEIYDIYHNNYEKFSLNEFIKNYINNILFYFSLGLTFFTIIAYILLLCYKCNGSYRIGFLIVEIISLVFKIFIMLYSINFFLKGLKKKLENDEYNEIEFLIKDYYNYYKCKTKYPVILSIQIIYLIIEITNIIYIFKNSTHESRTNHIPNKSSQVNIFQYPEPNVVEIHESEKNDNSTINHARDIVNNFEQFEIDNRNPEEINNENPEQNEGGNESSMQDNNENLEGNANNDVENTDSIANREEINEQEQSSLNPNSINIETKPLEKIILIKYEVTLFPGKYIEMKANAYNRFSLELDKLINLNEFFLDNAIKFIYTDKKMIYSQGLNEENKFRTLNDFNIEDNTIIHIALEETDINKIKDTNKIFIDNEKKEESKQIEQMPNNYMAYTLPFLKFVNTISNDNLIYSIQISYEEKLSDVINRLKSQYPMLQNYIIEEIRLGGKKYNLSDSHEIIFKPIKMLNLNFFEYIYLDGKIIEDNIIELHFYWKNNNKKEYMIKIGKKETFYNALLKLLSNKDFEYYFITYCWHFLNEAENVNINLDSDLQDTERIKLKKSKFNSYNDNVNDDKDIELEKVILYNETMKNDKTIENLNLNENTKIFFETKENISKIEEKIRNEEQQKYEDYKNENNNGDKQLITFNTTIGNRYVLFLDKNTILSQVINILNEKYKSLNNLKIKVLLCEGRKLEEEKSLEENSVKSTILILIDL